MRKKEERKEVLKTKHRKLKKKKITAGNPRVTRSGALNPPLRISHVAMTCLAPPLCIEYGEKPQETCLEKKKKNLRLLVIARTTTEPGEGGG